MPRVHEEIRQSRPFETPWEEGVVALMKTADVVRRALAAVVEPEGLTLQQYNVLRILRGAGAEGLPTLEIVDRLVEQTPGVTRLIDRLEAKELVRRERSHSDRRQVFCRITELGLELLARLDAPIREADRMAFRTLNEDELARLLELLDRTRNGPAAPAATTTYGG